MWCPANIIEMNMPVTSSAEKRGLPSSSLIDISTSSRSRSPCPWADWPVAPVHDLLHQRDQLDPGRVAALEALDRQVRVDVAERIGAALEVVVELGEPASSSSRNFGPIRHADDV